MAFERMAPAYDTGRTPTARRGLADLERAAEEDDGTAPVVGGWEFLAFS